MGVLERYAGARIAELAVVGQDLEAQLARVGAIQIARMVLDLQAALGHVNRRDRQVALGRDVPVIRQAELEAALRSLRVVGYEHAAAPPVLQRKGDVWEAEDRHIVEAQPRVLRGALFLFVVELDLGGLQHPVVAAGLAGGKARILEKVAIRPEDLQLLGGAARVALALQKIARLVEDAGVVARAVLHARAEEPVDAALQAYAAFSLRAAELGVVAQQVAENR